MSAAQKAGRPKKHPAKLRNVQVHFLVSTSEHAELRDAAAVLDVSVSTLLRQAALAKARRL